ncbi:thyrotropin-releasing hormone receptor-like [Neocloeon triangulifer]|uniref:thyrotropin-releasing hormone receptor-like n=1 Tax=Neocloeon triangulifer TaxID=2078957 RepID=UPI00286FA367|nr:thyrotropin-releasing hormone receptor-like [Neocloeon triangulifer]
MSSEEQLLASFNSSIQKIVSVLYARLRNRTVKVRAPPTTAKPFYEPCYSTVLFEILDFLHVYYIPFIVVVGICFNALNVYVFLKTHLKHRSSSYYLAALAVSDSGFLVSLGMIWFGDSIGVQTFNRSGWCQLVIYLSSTSSFLSVWLTVGFTIERFIAVQYPLKRPHVCTVARAKIVVLGLAILSLALNSYVLVIAGVVENEHGADTCDMRAEYGELLSKITLADSLITLAIPSVLLVFMNVLITRKLIGFNHRFHVDNQHDPSTGNAVSSDNLRRHLSSQHSLHSAKTISSRLTSNTNRSTGSTEASQTSRELRFVSQNVATTGTHCQRSITKMLLVISSTFLLLNMPSYVFRLYTIVQSLWGQPAPPPMWCLQQFCMLLYYTNFGINFILYSLCGSTFRRCVLQIVRRKICLLSKCFSK